MYNINLSNKYWIHLRPTLTVYKADSYGTSWLHYTAEGPASPCPEPDIEILLYLVLILNGGSKLERKHSIGNLRAECLHSRLHAGPGHHLSSQQRLYHHNLSEGGAKTLINVVIINYIHLSHLPLNCIKKYEKKLYFHPWYETSYS